MPRTTGTATATKPADDALLCSSAGSVDRGGGVKRSVISSRAPGYSKGMDIIRVIFAVIFPPLGVALQVGLRGAFWLNVLLTLLGFIPGIVHALYVILRR